MRPPSAAAGPEGHASSRIAMPPEGQRNAIGQKRAPVRRISVPMIKAFASLIWHLFGVEAEAAEVTEMIAM